MAADYLLDRCRRDLQEAHNATAYGPLERKLTRFTLEGTCLWPAIEPG